MSEQKLNFIVKLNVIKPFPVSDIEDGNEFTMSNKSHSDTSDHDQMETSVKFYNVLDFFHKDFWEVDVIWRNNSTLVITDIAAVLMVKTSDSAICQLEEVALDTHTNVSNVFYIMVKFVHNSYLLLQFL